MINTMLTTATQQRNSQGNLQSETLPISIETSPIAPIIDAARIFSLRLTARIKRISAIIIMSILMVFLSACGGGGGDVTPGGEDPISVSNLRVFPDVSSAILMWDNPDADIQHIDIIYTSGAAANLETRYRVTDPSKIVRAEKNVTQIISGLTATNYTFNIHLELKGSNENKPVEAVSITRLMGPNLDGDEYADADPLETDEDGDGTDDDMDDFQRDPTEDTDTDNDGVGDNADAFPTDGALSAFAVTELTATPGARNVTLNWNNPDNLVVQIARIDISYKRTGTNDAPMTISSSQTTSGAPNVKETITNLTNGQSYTFTVSLILMDPDAGRVGPAPSISATPDGLSVTELYGVAGVDYVTLSWTNPDAQVDSISISYQVSGSDNPQDAPTITDSPKIDANETVQHNISGLTLNEYYDFTVSLRLSGPDTGREGAPPSIRVRVNADYDGDGKNNFVDVDANGNGLIEIATAQQLNQSRHNLLGSNFTRSAGGVGDANGCGNGTMEGEDVTACNGYELIADIYLTTYANWQPIGRCPTLSSGRCDDLDALFNAIFDGNNHTINDLTITNPAGDYANASGLFGAISSDSILRNIHIRSGNLIGGGTNVGLLVGYARRGAMIINSSAEGAVTASGNNVGGLVGWGQFSTITSSYAAGGAVSGDGRVGGLVGDGASATITSSYAAGGDVSGTGNNVGGLVGYGLLSTITSSYAAGGDVTGIANFVGGLVGLGQQVIIMSSYAAGGAVSGRDIVGGLVGFGRFSTITSSYAAGGSVSGGDFVGGLVGLGEFATITASYWDDAVTITPSAGNNHGSSKTTNELQTPTEATGIYTTWAAGTCADGITLVWDFGTAFDYPALRCTPNGLPAQQHLRQR